MKCSQVDHALKLASFVTSGKLLVLSEPQLLHLGKLG